MICRLPRLFSNIIAIFVASNIMVKSKMSKTTIIYLLLSISLAMHASKAESTDCNSDACDKNNLTQYVDPMIGSGGHGHVFVGANVPFGFVQPGPTEHTRGWDWCSGYHYSDSVLTGFAQTHLSGTGIGDLGDISLLPAADASSHEATFSHHNEIARPGYYAVTLNGSGIRVELTASARVAMHRYSFPADKQRAYIILNLKEGIGWDRMTQCAIHSDPSPTRELSGYRFSSGWAKSQQVFFCAQFSRPVTVQLNNGDSVAVLTYENNGEPMIVKIGLSAVSEANAKNNIEAEIPQWDFDATAAKADKAWNDELGKIKIKSDDIHRLRNFYTCLFHTMIAPSVFCDVNGEYRGADGNVHHGDFTNYTTLSLWDVYRAAFPLYSLIQPERERDFALTFLNIYRQQGKLPVWHLMGNETDCMVGNPGVPVLTDIALKGFDVDNRAVLEAAKASQMKDERGLGLLKKFGYIPCDLDSINETVSKGLEYAIADWCVAQLAKKLGDADDYKYFTKRSKSYKDFYFDKKTGFMRGRTTKGTFNEPFNPFHAVLSNNDYTEGNAWQYTWLVPHDVHGLIKAFGGETPFITKLDSLFIVHGDLGTEAPPDISGLIGQYAHGNEPSHHILYLYAYAGQPWKAAPRLRDVMDCLYRDSIDGLCGNEDVGQMSAWYVLSAIGLYQVEPAGGRYVFGTPLLDKTVINVGNGKTFKITAIGNSNENIYIQSATLNGRVYTKSYIDYKDIRQGGSLEFVMGSKPSAFGTKKEDRP